MPDEDSGITSEKSENGSIQVESAMMSSGTENSDNSAIREKITSGDLIIHPTKPWPWIGTAQLKFGDFPRFCSNCGGLRVPSSAVKVAKSQYKMITNLENVPTSLSSETGPKDINIFLDFSQAGECFGDCMKDFDDLSHESMEDDDYDTSHGDYFHHIPAPPPLFSASFPLGPVTGNVQSDAIFRSLFPTSMDANLPGSHLQIQWFPAGEKTNSDGNEMVIVPFKQRSLFQEGCLVARANALNDQGLVKQVHRKVDAFVLPDYAWIIRDLSANKLKPLRDLEQAPGCFVIYKGWVGTVYNAWSRFTFRMADGTEFSITDDQQEIYSFMKEENRNLNFTEIYQLYPGLKLRARWMLLEKAKWQEGFQVPEHYKDYMKRSRQVWNNEPEQYISPFDRCSFGPPKVPDESTEEFKMNQDDIGDVPEAAAASKRHKSESVGEARGCLAPDLLESMKANDEAEKNMDIKFLGGARFGSQVHSAHLAQMQEYSLLLTVVKIESIKIDVEWISQVVADVPFGPKANVIEEEELKNVHVFRASRIFEPFDLGTRYRYIVEPGDTVIPSETWRQEIARDNHKDEPSHSDLKSSLPPKPKPGDCVYVSIVRSSSKIDVLWEDGTFETMIDPGVFVAQYTHQTEREYFPAMYVTPQVDLSLKARTKGWSSHRGKSDSGMDDTSQATRTSDDSTTNSFAISSSGSWSNWAPAKFGVVKRAKNTEKYATVAWFELKKGANDSEPEPILLNEEDVSFYDLKSYYEFNYVGGTLVSRIDPVTMAPGMPNVGYVLRKNPDASVQVMWHDGTEETTHPWKLRQLTSRYDIDMRDSSNVDDEQHYYSPTEHEYEDLEDFRYYDYMALSAESRKKRIGLIVAVMKEVIMRLCSTILIVNNYFPYAERKKLVKLTLNCNDICNGFVNLSDFRETIKTIFEHEQHQETGETSDSSSPTASKPKLHKGRFYRDERLVWQCANWLYDWTEAMTTLHEDVKKYRSKMPRKEAATQSAENQIAAADTTKIMSTDAVMEDSVKKDAPQRQLSDLHNSIETGLSTITGILSVFSGSDVDGSVVADYLRSLNVSGSDVNKAQQTTLSPLTVSSSENFASYYSSCKFLRTLLENPTKVSRLPCFCYTHHSDLQLSALCNLWPDCVSSSSENTRAGWLMGDQVKATGDERLKSCQEIVDDTGLIVEDVLHGRRDISYTDDDVLKLCNETADALCLSVLSIMIRVIESINDKLRPQISVWLTESKGEATERNSMDEIITAVEDEQECKQQVSSKIVDDVMEHNVDDHDEINSIKMAQNGFSAPVMGSAVVFELLPTAPASHRFISKQFDPTMMPKAFMSSVRREMKLLNSSLPPGIFVKTYEDRMDLFSCMIVGPQGTPYADGMFFFDVRLKDDYPSKPPHLFYKSMSKALNPNLYEDGMVCLSLLGTWDGKETELWTTSSTLLQVFISIQSNVCLYRMIYDYTILNLGLILVPQPYFNEPGFEKEKGSATGATKSRDYNEAAVLRTLESLQRVLNDPPEPFRNEICQHVVDHSARLMRLLEKYQDIKGDNTDLSFPLFPVTQGFCLCIKRHAENLRRLTQRWAFGDM